MPAGCCPSWRVNHSPFERGGGARVSQGMCRRCGGWMNEARSGGRANHSPPFGMGERGACLLEAEGSHGARRGPSSFRSTNLGERGEIALLGRRRRLGGQNAAEARARPAGPAAVRQRMPAWRLLMRTCESRPLWKGGGVRVSLGRRAAARLRGGLRRQVTVEGEGGSRSWGPVDVLAGHRAPDHGRGRAHVEWLRCAHRVCPAATMSVTPRSLFDEGNVKGGETGTEDRWADQDGGLLPGQHR
jgi:hypothetical protein